MYRKIVALVLGLNGLLLLAIGSAMIAKAPSTLAELSLKGPEAESLAVTLYALGMSDVGLSVFSLAAAYFIIIGRNAGRTLALIVGVDLIIVGAGIFLLTSALFGLLFIALRGAVIMALAWWLKPITDQIRAQT